MPNGDVNYSVSLMGVSLVSMMQVLSEMTVVMDTKFVLESSGEVYSLYTAVVVPQTGGGTGPESRATFTTPQQSMWL